MPPNVKAQFVDQGFTFTESFVTALRRPSRATSLTGQYAHNHGVLGHANETNGGISRFNASSTVATWLRTSGYRTGYAGKYLSGYGTWTAPTYVPPGWDNWLGTLEPNYHSMYDYSVNYNGAVIDFGPLNEASGNAFYQTDLIAAQAGNFIATPSSKPFSGWRRPPPTWSSSSRVPTRQRRHGAGTSGATTPCSAPSEYDLRQRPISAPADAVLQRRRRQRQASLIGNAADARRCEPSEEEHSGAWRCCGP